MSGAGAFLESYPHVPTAELVFRDYGTFRTAQRELVASLLRARRFCVGVAASPHVLLTHAGVTETDLDAAGIGHASSDAFELAAALDDALDRAVGGWAGDTPLVIPGLHEPGRAALGEGRGIFYHRPGNPGVEAAQKFAAGRRFDPRQLPRGLTQAIGHTADRKCREMLGEWVTDSPGRLGPLRHLQTDGRDVRLRTRDATGQRRRWPRDGSNILDSPERGSVA